jgi:hypothetical protein
MILSNKNTFTIFVNKILQITDTLVIIFGNVDNIIVTTGGVYMVQSATWRGGSLRWACRSSW